MRPLSSPKPITEADQKKKFEALQKLQKENGSFKFEQPLASVVGVDFDMIKKEVQRKGFDLDGWATSIAVSYMDYGLTLLKDDEEMVKKNGKAVQWLEEHWIESMEDMQTMTNSFYTPCMKCRCATCPFHRKIDKETQLRSRQKNNWENYFRKIMTEIMIGLIDMDWRLKVFLGINSLVGFVCIVNDVWHWMF